MLNCSTFYKKVVLIPQRGACDDLLWRARQPRCCAHLRASRPPRLPDRRELARLRSTGSCRRGRPRNISIPAGSSGTNGCTTCSTPSLKVFRVHVRPRSPVLRPTRPAKNVGRTASRGLFRLIAKSSKGMVGVQKINAGGTVLWEYGSLGKRCSTKDTWPPCDAQAPHCIILF